MQHPILPAASVADILRELDERGLIEPAQRVARSHGVPLGDIVRPVGRAAEKARQELWAQLRARGMHTSTIARTFDVSALEVRTGADAWDVAHADTQPPPEAA